MDYACKSDDAGRFSLHDCRPSSAEFANGKLYFYFPDGIFCDSYGENWPNTGKAAVVLSVDDAFSFTRFIEDVGRSFEKKYTIAQLVEKVNSEEWELEFAYWLHGEHGYSCWIWTKEEGTDYGELCIGNGRIAFYWNPPGAGC